MSNLGVSGIAKQGLQILRNRGVRDFVSEGTAFARESGYRMVHSATGKVNSGTPVYDYDWDVLIILDACRPDFLREVSNEYDFLTNVDEVKSVGSYSKAWMNRNFTPEYSSEMSQTVHVTGNPFTEEALNSEDFLELDEVWRYSWDEDMGTIRPRPLTDQAIMHARDMDPSRMIVHYMQPHAPFTTHPELQTGPSAEDWSSSSNKSIWTLVREGEVPIDVVKNAYRDELRHVLDDVELLLENLDAETVAISADHGEAMGEHGFYGHARGVAIDALRVVPWCITSATDHETHQPEMRDELETQDGKHLERLQDLGYL